MAAYERIESKSNPKIKEAAALNDARERKKTGLFLAEGARLCADAAENGVEIVSLFITDKAAETYEACYHAVLRAAAREYRVSETAAERLSDTVSSQNFFCVCRRKPEAARPDPAGAYLLTDRIQDPDNLGALARSAEAFGADGLIVCGGCDIYAPKALRASMGALLRFPVFRRADAADTVRECVEAGMRAYAAVLHRDALDLRAVTPAGGRLVVIGNEGQGVSPAAAEACTDYVTIPMAGRAESLNAAAAGAVLLWELIGKTKI